ncbi:MAG: hypothetical protein MJZ89_05395, partial [Paludibacteraceae bacterium]|nr:hypothetical protein [Paludibacteraceae bacterium]
MSNAFPHIDNRRRSQLIYILMDMLTSLMVWFGFLLFRWLVYEGRIFTMETVLFPAFDFYRPLILYPLFCLIIYYLSGYYMQPRRRRIGQELLTTLLSACVISLV